MPTLLAIGLGGFVGAILRYLLSEWVHVHTDSRFPAGTLAVNALGCLAIGVLMTLALEREALGERERLFLVTGLLGSFTTFSTFGFETLVLMREDQMRLALFSVVGNLVLGGIAVVLGRFLTLALVRP